MVWSEDDDRPCGNFWQRAKRRLRLALRSSHEFTPLHLHAAALLRRLASLRGNPNTDTLPYPQTETRAAAETHRAGQTAPERVAHPFRKTASDTETKILPVTLTRRVARGVFLSRFRFVSYPVP